MCVWRFASQKMFKFIHSEISDNAPSLNKIEVMFIIEIYAVKESDSPTCFN